MNIRTLSLLSAGMYQVKAEEQLWLMDAAQYPHAQKEDRKKVHKKYYKMANPVDKREAVKTSDLKLI